MQGWRAGFGEFSVQRTLVLGRLLLVKSKVPLTQEMAPLSVATAGAKVAPSALSGMGPGPRVHGPIAQPHVTAKPHSRAGKPHTSSRAP